MKKAIKTESRFYIFIELCNGGDMKDMMEIKNWQIYPDNVQKVMNMLVTGVNDMLSLLVIHRDLKL